MSCEVDYSNEIRLCDTDRTVGLPGIMCSECPGF